ncbi:TlpA disulfide reductase family protein [Prevotella sp. 10(H)]|uniref:TlpA disulfide reductase family protein n=1 Tax=Prevotella sp. 10(H) TaxID=1158294 RepID=UPI0004A764A0|nr:TlpA disulfide reductase family protein [Prevotella sp. 10(H)]
MKKVTLFLAVIILLMTSCAEKDTYTISGTVAGNEYEGKAVYLQALDSIWKDKVNIDTTYVKGGKFTFKRTVKESESLCFITFEDSPEEKTVTMIPIFIEPGNIELSVDDSGRMVDIKGTSMNEAVRDFFSAMARSEAPDSELLAEFTKKNNQNLLGAYFLTCNARLLDVSEVRDILASFKPELLKYKAVQNMEKTLQKREETSVGKKYVDVKGITPEGNDVALSDYVGKGKYVLVSFWASWNLASCRREIPYLLGRYTQFKNKDIEVVGVSLDKDVEEWKKAMAELNITWPQISDLKGWDSESISAYGIDLIPYYILIDKDGVIMERGGNIPIAGENKLSKLTR